MAENFNNTELASTIAKFNTTFRTITDGLIASLENAVTAFDNYQKPLLGLGLNLNSVPEAIKKAALDLPIGLENALGTVTEAFQAGLFAVDKSTLELAGRMKVTGEDSMVLFRGIRTLEAAMGDYAGGTSQLSKDLKSTSETYHISTTSLISVMTSLEKTFELTRPLANTTAMAKLSADLLGEAGAGQEKLVSRFVAAFADPSVQAKARATALGIGDLQTKMLSSPEGITSSELMAGFKVATERYNELATQGVQHQKVAADFYGDLGVSILSLGNVMSSMDVTTREGLAVQKKFDETWVNFKDEMMKPILNVLTGIAERVLSFANFIGSGAFGLLLAMSFTKVLATSFIGPLAAAFLPGFVSAIGAGLAPIILPIMGIAAIVLGIRHIMRDKESADEQVANETSLREQRKYAETSRFSETIKNELTNVMSIIQMNGISQLELLRDIIRVNEDGTVALAGAFSNSKQTPKRMNY